MHRMKPFVVALMVVASSLMIAYSYSFAGVEEDIAQMRQELNQLKGDVAEIKNVLNALLNRPKAPEKTTSRTTIDNDPVLGSSSAPLTLVEFSDYQCPFCGRFFKDTYPIIKEAYVKTGKLRYVYRDYPLPFHKEAEKAHEAANCAGEQGKYWEMHDRIFGNQAQMQVQNLRESAEALGVNMLAFNACLDSGKYADEIKKDIEDGNKAGVQGTPTFILGQTRETGEVEGPLIRGAQPTDNFKKEIDRLLEEVSRNKGPR